MKTLFITFISLFITANTYSQYFREIADEGPITERYFIEYNYGSEEEMVLTPIYYVWSTQFIVTNQDAYLLTYTNLEGKQDANILIDPLSTKGNSRDNIIPGLYKEVISTGNNQVIHYSFTGYSQEDAWDIYRLFNKYPYHDLFYFGADIKGLVRPQKGYNGTQVKVVDNDTIYYNKMDNHYIGFIYNYPDIEVYLFNDNFFDGRDTGEFLTDKEKEDLVKIHKRELDKQLNDSLINLYVIDKSKLNSEDGFNEFVSKLPELTWEIKSDCLWNKAKLTNYKSFGYGSKNKYSNKYEINSSFKGYQVSYRYITTSESIKKLIKSKDLEESFEVYKDFNSGYLVQDNLYIRKTSDRLEILQLYPVNNY